MELSLWLLGLGLSVWFLVVAIKKGKAIERYEFDNRTSGGVVEFSDYDAARRHQVRRSVVTGLTMFAFGCVLVTLLMSLAATWAALTDF